MYCDTKNVLKKNTARNQLYHKHLQRIVSQKITINHSVLYHKVGQDLYHNLLLKNTLTKKDTHDLMTMFFGSNYAGIVAEFMLWLVFITCPRNYIKAGIAKAQEQSQPNHKVASGGKPQQRNVWTSKTSKQS